jgi:hypothetical protein
MRPANLPETAVGPFINCTLARIRKFKLCEVFPFRYIRFTRPKFKKKKLYFELIMGVMHSLTMTQTSSIAQRLSSKYSTEYFNKIIKLQNGY